MTLASARWAAVGDTISRLLEATGSEVAREYYFNDHGAQIDRFATIAAGPGAAGSELPEDGYQGSYIAEIAPAVLDAASRDRRAGRRRRRGSRCGPTASR